MENTVIAYATYSAFITAFCIVLLTVVIVQLRQLHNRDKRIKTLTDKNTQLYNNQDVFPSGSIRGTLDNGYMRGRV